MEILKPNKNPIDSLAALEAERTKNSFNPEPEDPEPVDMVNHPSHYKQYKMETIDIMEASSTDEEFQGYLKCNIIKYLLRYRFKNGAEDLEKAMFYLKKLVEKVK